MNLHGGAVMKNKRDRIIFLVGILMLVVGTLLYRQSVTHIIAEAGFIIGVIGGAISGGALARIILNK